MPRLDSLLTYEEPSLTALNGRAKKYGFASPRALEHLWWDYEFIAQTQSLNSDFILRGGAAAQLYVDPQLQRASIDVDIITTLSLDKVRQVVGRLIRKFASSPISIEEYTPRKPVRGLDQVTYHVHFPKLGGKGGTRRIKLEFQSGLAGLPWNLVSGKETIAMVVDKVKCVTVGALIGDKLTTLASNTIGVDIEDQPKQLYDLENLAFSHDLSAGDIGHVASAFVKIAKHEAAMKGASSRPIDVIDDIERTLTAFSKVDSPGGPSRAKLKVSISAFETSYVSKNGATDDSGWSLRALRLRFLVRTVRRLLESEASRGEVAKLLSDAKVLGHKLSSNNSAKEGLVAMFEARGGEFQGKPIERLFWEVADPHNLAKIRRAVREYK